MINVDIGESHALIHVVSGALDVTYEVKPGVVYSRAGIASNGFVFDLVGIDREQFSAPYVFGGHDFDALVIRGMRKARHLERAWRKTAPHGVVAAA